MRFLMPILATLILTPVALAKGYEKSHPLKHERTSFKNLSGQSPIDIETGNHFHFKNITLDPTPHALRPDWKKSSLSLINNGATLQITYDKGSSLKHNGQNFELKQFHFHSPSEHMLDGRHYPLEVHFVHKALDNSLLVVGVFVKEGKENPLLKSICTNAPADKSKLVHVMGQSINALDFIPSLEEYFNYVGSLTTPPFTEGVNWIIMRKTLEASADQIKKIQKILKDPNNRPLQPLNGRTIVLQGKNT